MEIERQMEELRKSQDEQRAAMLAREEALQKQIEELQVETRATPIY